MTQGERTALLVGSLALVGVGGFVVVRNLKTKSSTTSPTSPKPTLAQKAAAAGWTQYQGGAYYTAGHGATLTALASIIGIPVATLVRYNCRSSATILLGAVIHTAQQTCPPSGSGGSGSGGSGSSSGSGSGGSSGTQTLTESQCNTLIMSHGFTYSIRNVGSSLPCVVWIQRLLNARMGSRLALDGDFGPKTKKAVVAFQNQAHLPVTGIVNSTTWQALHTGQ